MTVCTLPTSRSTATLRGQAWRGTCLQESWLPLPSSEKTSHSGFGIGEIGGRDPLPL